MEIKFKKMDERAVAPYKKHLTDAGVDLTAISVEYDEETDCIIYDTGIAVEIPAGYFGLVVPRSSIHKTDLMLTNHAGIIDSDYRGTIKAKFKIMSDYDYPATMYGDFNELLQEGKFCIYVNSEVAISGYSIYKLGDRICQLIIVPIPLIEYIESDTLSDTERGDGGFGSTGK